MLPRGISGVCSRLNAFCGLLSATAPSSKRKREAGSPPFRFISGTVSVQPEINFHVDLHRYRLSILHGGLEFPVAHRLDGFLVQSHAQRARHLDVMRPAIRTHNQPQHAGTLIFGLARLLRVFRIRRIDRARSGHAAAYTENPAPDTAAPAWTNSRPSTRTHAATRTRADATARTGTVGGRACWNHGLRIAEVRQIVSCQMHLWGNHNRGLSGQLGVVIAHHHGRGSNLLHCQLRELAFGRLELVSISAAATTADSVVLLI